MQVAVEKKTDPGGNASPLLIISDSDSRECDELTRELGDEFSILALSGGLPAQSEVMAFSQSLMRHLESQKIKRITVCGIRAGAAIAQALSVLDPKQIRRLILLDATTRLEPGVLSRSIDWLERFLPLGLPLRSLSRDFDSRPFLHRIRCPSLVLHSPGAGLYLRSQANYLAHKIPNAWLRPLYNEQELAALVLEFMQVPTKRSQKA